jgi:hypothetical protein
MLLLRWLKELEHIHFFTDDLLTVAPSTVVVHV